MDARGRTVLSEAANLKGSLFMVAAMAAFAVEDMLLKHASASLPVGQVMVIFGLGGMAAFAALARARGEGFGLRIGLTRTMAVRSGFELFGRLFYTLAIALTPLSSASVILQATPLVVMAGAALFLGEAVGWRRWLAVGVGFAGVMMVLRPGLEGFSVLSLLAVAGMIGFAGRDLATRAAPPAMGNFQLGLWGFAMVTIAGAGLLAASGGAVMPSAATALVLACATLFGVSAYWALTVAMRTGEVGVVTPFRYTRLVFGVTLGALVFGEQLDAPTLAGSALIVGSGLYTLWRARRLRAAAARQT